MDDSAEALEVTEVATLDNLFVSSCFLTAANDTNESSLLDDVLIGVDADGACDDDDAKVDCLEEPAQTEKTFCGLGRILDLVPSINTDNNDRLLTQKMATSQHYIFLVARRKW